MATLWFENSQGNRRKIAECTTLNDVYTEINKFIDHCNEGKPENKKFRSYYTRVWSTGGQTHFDVGSHTEFFHWDKVVERNELNG